MTQVLVEITGSDPTRRRALLETFASLPRSFAVAGRADVVAICDGDRWVSQAGEAIRRGKRDVVVMEPTEGDPDDIEALAATAADAGVTVRLARRWASNPAVTALRDKVLEAGSTVWIDSHATVDLRTPLPELLGTQVDLLTTLFGGSAQIHDRAHTSSSYLVAGRLTRGGERFHLAGSRSAAVTAHIRVRELLSRGRRSLRLLDGTTAAPGHAEVSDASGRKLLPTHYESGYRAVWRSLHDQPHAPHHPDTTDLRQFADVRRAVAHAL